MDGEKRPTLRRYLNWKMFSFLLWKVGVCIITPGIIILQLFICAKRVYRTQKRQCLVFVLASSLVGTYWFSTAYWFPEKPDPHKYPDVKTTNDLVEQRLQDIISSDKGTGCVMPVLDPFSEEAMQFTKDVGKLVCEGVDWVECYKSECQATKHIQRQMKNLVCTYRDIIFVTDYKNEIGEAVKVYGGDKYQLNRSDHVKVSCTGTDVNGLGIFSTRWDSLKLGLRPLKPEPINAYSVNIMIVMFDSASRNGFIRRMPKSYKFLVEELKAVVMKSYNIVMDATTGALFPMLTGHMELELPDARITETNHRLVDDTPFIFHLLKEHGFRTAYFEDMARIGTFQYRFNGFQNPPTDHYMRPFFIEDWHNAHHQIWWTGENDVHCVGALTQHCIMLNATSQFFELDGPKFSFTFIVGISHENVNMLSFGDEDLVNFLKRYQQNLMDDTVLIVMGDHGARFASIRDTFQGKIEERLPFVSLVLPEKLKRSRPEALNNLINNSEVLTTHYDMHTTLLDILNMSEHRNAYKVPGSDMERGMSLLKPIGKSRSCAEAGIMPHWCACARWEPMSPEEPLYARAARALADYINTITAGARSQCATRTLNSVQWVLHQSPDVSMLGFDFKQEVDRYIGKYERSKHVKASNEYYQAKITLDPGHSVFEGSMEYIVKDDVFIITEQDISRVNPYGDEPKCLSGTLPFFNKYCYCKRS